MTEIKAPDIIESAIAGILRAVGEDVDREGLKDTPARAARTLMYSPETVIRTMLRAIERL